MLELALQKGQHLCMDPDIARAEMLERRMAQSSEAVRRASEVVVRRLLALPELAGSLRIGAYLGVRGEVDPSALRQVDRLEVALPVTTAGEPLRFVVPTGPLEEGPYGIRQPGEGTEVTPLDLDVVVVPADRIGRRRVDGRAQARQLPVQQRERRTTMETWQRVRHIAARSGVASVVEPPAFARSAALAVAGVENVNIVQERRLAQASHECLLRVVRSRPHFRWHTLQRCCCKLRRDAWKDDHAGGGPDRSGPGSDMPEDWTPNALVAGGRSLFHFAPRQQVLQAGVLTPRHFRLRTTAEAETPAVFLEESWEESYTLDDMMAKVYCGF